MATPERAVAARPSFDNDPILAEARVKYPLAIGVIGALPIAFAAAIVSVASAISQHWQHPVLPTLVVFSLAYLATVPALARGASRRRVWVTERELIVRWGPFGEPTRLSRADIAVVRATKDQLGPWRWERLYVARRPPSVRDMGIPFLDDAAAVAKVLRGE